MYRIRELENYDQIKYPLRWKNAYEQKLIQRVLR